MHLFNSFKNSGKLYIFLIFLAVFFSWFPTLFVEFLSDDYQIIFWHKTTDLTSAFRHLHSPYILDVYWRPLGSISFCLTYLIAGFTPFYFHLGNLLLYALCCVMVFKTGEAIGLKRTTAFLAAIFFSILPSHELPAAWLSCRGDTMAALFLLTTAYFYIQFLKNNRALYAAIALISFAAALLSKEIAFAGIAIPLILLLRFPFKGDGFKKHLCPTIISIAIATALLAAVLIYRITVIGGSPFDSPHFSQPNLLLWLKNLAFYIPLTFATPEFLEQELFFLRLLKPVHLILFAIIFLIFVLLIRVFFKASQETKLIVRTGLAWFIIFIIPALPTLMRWYVFTASVGLIWAIAPLLESYYHKNLLKTSRIVFKTGFVFIIIVLIINVRRISTTWQSASHSVAKSVESLAEFQKRKYDTVIVLAAPDKIARITALKLGLQQTIQYGLKDFGPDSWYRESVEVMSPLRVESGLYTEIEMRKSGDTVDFMTMGARLIPEKARSTSIVQSEEFETQFYGQQMKIRTMSLDGRSFSKAQLIMPPPREGTLFLYFDGKIFKEL